jgi:DDE family transposase
MAWCKSNGVDFIFGLAKNVRLTRAIGGELMEARDESQLTGQPERRFKELIWSTRKSWSRQRRGHCQGRVDERRSQSALHRHLVDRYRWRCPVSL